MKKIILALLLSIVSLLINISLLETAWAQNVVLGSGGTNSSGQSIQANEFTGAATYSIPIPVPPGRGGLQPNIVLDYNSMRKNPNSWVGNGWELNLGSIERVPENGEIDFNSGHSFEARFLGQGERLKLIQEDISLTSYGITSSSATQGDLYKAKVQSGFEIYIHLQNTSSSTATDLGWVVIDKSGNKYTFGNDANSREEFINSFAIPTPLFDFNSHNVSKWFLSQIEDRNGNLIEINYGIDQLPDEIQYQDITISFTRSNSSPTIANQNVPNYRFPVFQQNFLATNQTRKILKRITIRQNGARLQKFDLKYEVSSINSFRKLKQLQQFGKTDAQSLPPISFDYYNHLSYQWESSPTDWQADRSTSNSSQSGALNQFVTFADMDGDGLKDQVVAHAPDSDKIYVYYNNGEDFVETADSEWTDPLSFSCSQGFDCTGRLNAYLNFGGELIQFAYLMDMNGDSLPDRVVRNQIDSDTADFMVSLNNGSEFLDPKPWRDPHIGTYAGYSDNDRGFMDMNGDGLVDRIVGDNNNHRFLVYYNNGASFAQNPDYWNDPLHSINSSHNGIGRLSITDDKGTFAFLQDVNSDGLPDRVFKADINVNDEEVNEGFGVVMNRNGLKWATFSLDGNVGIYDGVNLLALYDPIANTDHRGYTNDLFDLADFNNDGYVDRIESDAESNKIKVHHFAGQTPSPGYNIFSSSVNFTDPISNSENQGVVRVGTLNNMDTNYHTFISDINGDGYPDRVELNEQSGKYEVYRLKVNSIVENDVGATSVDWVNQPTSALKRINDNQGNITVVEYIPSNIPRYWPAPNHRFLPFKIDLVHRIFKKDYSVPNSAIPEPFASRHSNVRWTTYSYSGGNHYTLSAIKQNPSSATSTSLDRNYHANFDGFQEVEKEIYKFDSETWVPFTTTTYYHQSIDSFSSSYYQPPNQANTALFDSMAYNHQSLSGRAYRKIIEQGSTTIIEENNTWSVNGVTSGLEIGFECQGTCQPKLTDKEKIVTELGGGPSRISHISYDYDDFGNVTEEILKDGNNIELLTKSTSYYGPSTFANDLQLRNRIHTQTLSQNNQTYRSKEFLYDSNGNMTDERFYHNNSSYLAIQRSYTAAGNLETETGLNGVTRTLTYSGDEVFPQTEYVVTPSGSQMTTSFEYDRFSGKTTLKTPPNGTANGTVYDDFGRPIEEYLNDTSGTATTIKSYAYSYETHDIENLTTVLFKTEIWEPKELFPSTLTTPSSITYRLGNGQQIQSCQLSERGDYRLTQFRKDNGGREEITTEPDFSTQCSVHSALLSNPQTKTTKDIHGRPILIDPPAGDSNSPVLDTTVSYSTNSSHQLKVTTEYGGQSKIEYYDQQNRLVKTQDSLGSLLTFEYNPIGDLRYTYDNGNLTSEVQYDLMGRKTALIDSDMGSWSYEYYPSNNQLYKQTDAIGQYKIFNYDTLARLSQVDVYDQSDTLESSEVYTHDSGNSGHNVIDGELFRVQTFDGNSDLQKEIRFGYDSSHRRLIKTTDTVPELGDFVKTRSYNTRGLVTGSTFPTGETVYYKYNLVDGLTQICSQENCNSETGEIYYSIDASTAFDQMGNLLEESFGNGVTVSRDYYPNSHRLSSSRIHKSNTNYSHKTYTHDAYGNINSINDSIYTGHGSATLLSIQYDDLNRIQSYTKADSTIKSFTYDTNGNLLTNTESQVSDSYQYTSSKLHAVTQIGSQNFAYDDNGNLTSDGARTLSYNADNNLEQITMNNGAVVNFAYDHAGSRYKKTVTKTNPLGRVTTASTYYLGKSIEIKGSKLLLHIFAGETKIATKTLGTLDEIVAASTGLKPNFNPSLRFTSAAPYLFLMILFLIFYLSRLTFLQEALNQLHRDFCYKFASFILVFLFVFQTPLHAFASTNDFTVTPQSDENYFYYIHGDHLGSTHLLTEGNASGGKHSGILYKRGEILQRIEYTPYGKESYVLNPNLQFEPGFTGQSYDAETGLYYYQSRYYDPLLARFVQPDTIVPDPKDLQSHNRYSYVLNNPLKYIDPTGHFGIPFGGNSINPDFQGNMPGGVPGFDFGFNTGSILGVGSSLLNFFLGGAAMASPNFTDSGFNFGIDYDALIDDDFNREMESYIYAFGVVTGIIDSKKEGVSIAFDEQWEMLFVNDATFELKPHFIEGIKVYRKDINLFGDDKYGHWWIEIDGKESYGWWPKRAVGVIDTFIGVEGELNGQTLTNGQGTPTRDPHHGDRSTGVRVFEVYGKNSKETIIRGIKDFIKNYEGNTWSWPLGCNCHSFQEELLEKNGLTIQEVK